MAKKRLIYFSILVGMSLILSCTTTQITPSSIDSEPTTVPPLANISNGFIKPRPEYIAAISPPENYIIPLDLYNFYPEGRVDRRALLYDAKDISTFQDGFDRQICVRPLIEKLVQPGDFFVEGNGEGEKLVDRITFFVNDQMITMKPYENGGNTIVLTPSPTTPRSMWTENVSYCWEVQLDVGTHEITFSFLQSSGEAKTYVWFYEITE